MWMMLLHLHVKSDDDDDDDDDEFLNFQTPKFWCNSPKIQTKRPNLKVFHLKMQMVLQTVKTLIRLLLEEQSDQGLHCLPRPICPKT